MKSDELACYLLDSDLKALTHQAVGQSRPSSSHFNLNNKPELAGSGWRSVSRSMTGGKHSQLASASFPASPSSPFGSNRSTEPWFVIQVKVGRSSGFIGQLSEVEPEEETLGPSGCNSPWRCCGAWLHR